MPPQGVGLFQAWLRHVTSPPFALQLNKDGTLWNSPAKSHFVPTPRETRV
jgi:hypothetical protein